MGEVVSPRAREGYKRAFDLAVFIGAHLLLLPLWLLLWIAIPLAIVVEDGLPVLFGQPRVGKDGRVFKAYKFRTMIKDAEKRGPIYTTEDDERVLRVGRILRATGLDELPQLINILRGEMSFVGPRPLPVEDHRMCERRIPRFHERTRVRPGLAGPAQLLADRLSREEWLRLDLAYIERMSPWLDLKLLILCALASVLGRCDRRGPRLACRWGLREFLP